MHLLLLAKGDPATKAVSLMFNQQMFFCRALKHPRHAIKRGGMQSPPGVWSADALCITVITCFPVSQTVCQQKKGNWGKSQRQRQRERDMAFLRMEIELWLNHMDHEVHGALFFHILHLLVLACSCMPNVHIPFKLILLMNSTMKLMFGWHCEP